MKKLLFAFVALLPLHFASAETESVSQLNELLKGEMSAVTTYNQALEKVKDQPQAKELQTVLNEHLDAVKTFKGHVTGLGGKPTDEPGVWGSWATTVMGTSKLFGDASALKALKEGEEHGLKEYKELLEDKSIPQNIKTEVKSKYIPSQEAHIQLLDKLIEKA